MFALMFGLLTACGPKEDSDTGGLYCTEIFIHSVSLTLEDESGAPVTGAHVSYTVDGVEGTVVEEIIEGEYVVGGEEAGYFEIDIYVEIPRNDGSDCIDLAYGSVNTTVEADECHVIPQVFTPDLDWEVVCLDE